MKFSTLSGVALALVLATAPLQAETLSTGAAAETGPVLPAPLGAGLVLIALAFLAVKLARRKLSRLNWDSLD